MYSTGLINLFGGMFQNESYQEIMCLNAEEAISINENNTFDLNDLQVKLTNILKLYPTENYATIVYFGYADGLNSILNSLNQILKNQSNNYNNNFLKITIITSEANINSLIVNTNPKISILSLRLKSIGISNDIILYYTKLLNSIIKSQSSVMYLNDAQKSIYDRMPWIYELIINRLKCNFADNYIQLANKQEYRKLSYCNFYILPDQVSTSVLNLPFSQYLRYLFYNLAAFNQSLYDIIKRCVNCDGHISQIDVRNMSLNMRNMSFDITKIQIIPDEIKGNVTIQDGKLIVTDRIMYDLLNQDDKSIVNRKIIKLKYCTHHNFIFFI